VEFLEKEKVTHPMTMENISVPFTPWEYRLEQLTLLEDPPPWRLAWDSEGEILLIRTKYMVEMSVYCIFFLFHQ
jgi:hypothetical protein